MNEEITTTYPPFMVHKKDGTRFIQINDGIYSLEKLVNSEEPVSTYTFYQLEAHGLEPSDV
jgi:hypothetical protein